MAKGQLRSNREKKKPKAEKNKKKSAPVPSAFERVRMIGKTLPVGNSRNPGGVQKWQAQRSFGPKHSF